MTWENLLNLQGTYDQIEEITGIQADQISLEQHEAGSAVLSLQNIFGRFLARVEVEFDMASGHMISCEVI